MENGNFGTIFSIRHLNLTQYSSQTISKFNSPVIFSNLFITIHRNVIEVGLDCEEDLVEVPENEESKIITMLH